MNISKKGQYKTAVGGDFRRFQTAVSYFFLIKNDATTPFDTKKLSPMVLLKSH